MKKVIVHPQCQVKIALPIKRKVAAAKVVKIKLCTEAGIEEVVTNDFDIVLIHMFIGW